MVLVQYPEPAFRIRQENDREQIFDEYRKRWVPLTPEEWVRQNFLQYLVKVKNYPATLVAVEKEIMLGELKKRFDILVYDTQHKPWMMIECKSMDVELNESILEQLLRYNISVPVPYLVITNGSFCFAGYRDGKAFQSLDTLPSHQ